MTTVVDPNGTPVPVYNRSGTAIIELSANGTDQTDAIQIATVSQRTIVLLTTTDEDRAAKLPADAQIGDEIEVFVYPVSPNTFYAPNIFPASGDKIKTVTDRETHCGENGIRYLRVASDDWAIFNGNG